MWIDFRRARTLLALMIPVLVGFGPCGPIAGTQLSGQEVPTKVKNFQFVSDVDNCALEVNSADPHSVNVNCWTVGQQLYIGCMECEGKTWSTLVNDNAMARVKIGENLYRVKATKINDDFVINRAWGIRWAKYEEGDVGAVPEGYWLYHLGSRPSG